MHDYPELNAALPSLFWSRAPGDQASIYHLSAEQPDPSTGRWRYQFSHSDIQG